jgi:hypothetical protein
MTPTTYQQQDFIKDVIPSNLLDDAVIWVGNNMSPDQIFPKEILHNWAVENGYSKEQ